MPEESRGARHLPQLANHPFLRQLTDVTLAHCRKRVPIIVDALPNVQGHTIPKGVEGNWISGWTVCFVLVSGAPPAPQAKAVGIHIDGGPGGNIVDGPEGTFHAIVDLQGDEYSSTEYERGSHVMTTEECDRRFKQRSGDLPYGRMFADKEDSSCGDDPVAIDPYVGMTFMNVGRRNHWAEQIYLAGACAHIHTYVSAYAHIHTYVSSYTTTLHIPV